MAGATRILKDPWPYRSTAPGAPDSFDIDGLQRVLRDLDGHSRWVQDYEPDAPVEGDLWSDTASRVLRGYFGGKWVAANIGYAFDAASYGLLGDPSADYTVQWVNLLNDVVNTTGGSARIVL